MATQLSLAGKKDHFDSCVYIVEEGKDWKKLDFSKAEISHIEGELKNAKKFFYVPRPGGIIFIQVVTSDTKPEDLRKNGSTFCASLNTAKISKALISDEYGDAATVLAFAEGVLLSNYQFLKYRSDAEKETNSLEKVAIHSKKVTKDQVKELSIIADAVFFARDLVNEPQSYLNAVQMAEDFEKMAKETGLKVEVLNKAKIESLKMGGLLAVNMGSNIPPTFTILEWKPKNAVNKNPVVLVGKGVVYDTGGLSLKPTPNSMDYMKCDMAGGATVAAAAYACARLELPVHVISLIPATDNRPGQDAYTPGDVIKMYNGMTIEVLNTDAEGRMILADALAYAGKFKPELVMDFATLTGAAAAAIGPYGMVCMGTAPEPVKEGLKTCGNDVHERLVEMPFWDDYAELLKSDIADMKNIGGPIAGAITAGKFLERFTSYPWMHFDIAGPAFLHKTDSYRGKNGTGVGVRFLVKYFQDRSKA